jgi:uncharacterized Zn finger protein
MDPRKKIKCPYCGYAMPIEREEQATCKGVFVKCKGRNCGKVFEIIIKPDK